LKLFISTNILPSSTICSDYTTTVAKIKINAVHRSTLCSYISEPRVDTSSNPTEINVWFKIEERTARKEILNRTSDIDDLKKVALKEQHDRDLYEAHYCGHRLRPGEKVPSNTADDQPVILKKIIRLPPTDARGKLWLSVHSTQKLLLTL
jgi:hypothetical protein